MKNSSHINKRVFLTEEELVELKLTLNYWILYVPNISHSRSDIILSLQKTTNLVYTSKHEASGAGATVTVTKPKIKIITYHNISGLRTSVLYPEENYVGYYL